VGTAFRRRRDGTLTATLHVGEVELLRNLVSQLLELISDGEPARPSDPLEQVLDLASAEPPSDPVLRRLFPDAYADDAAAGDFRRYTERGLRESKRTNAAVVLAGLDSAQQARKDVDRTVVLDKDDAEAWMRALTDLRLALGTRLGVEQDSPLDESDHWDEDGDDPRRYVLGVYEWLGWLQDTLVHAVMR
jgi:hypothetical protein